jgi:hypothetical protein
MREIGYVFKGFLCIGLMVDGKPCIVRRGLPLPQIPEAEWQRLLQKCPSTFTCGQCAEPVLGFKAPSAAAITQACRCTIVSHFCPAQPYSSGTDWSDFQAMYEREKIDPASPECFRRDPLFGQSIGLSKTGQEWVRRKLGVSSDVNISDDGMVLTVGDGSFCVGPDGNSSALADSDEGLKKIGEMIGAIRAKFGATSEEVPPLIVVTGWDDDYVWPPSSALNRIKPAPFRCPLCKARVKHAPLQHMGALDQTFLCLCMSVMFRRDTPRPTSSGQWDEIRLAGGTQKVWHKATTANGQN